MINVLVIYQVSRLAFSLFSDLLPNQGEAETVSR